MDETYTAGGHRIDEPLEARDSGYLEGLSAYAWWKDGTQYVGTTGTTLAQAEARYLAEQGYEVKRR